VSLRRVIVRDTTNGAAARANGIFGIVQGAGTGERVGRPGPETLWSGDRIALRLLRVFYGER
jgi:hypothetical protein